ncbi:MAG: cytochrome c family protein, partial [bacterium]
MKCRAILVSMVVALIIPTWLGAQSKFKYVGAKACMPCHLTPKSGAAYKIWQDSKHSKAFA